MRSRIRSSLNRGPKLIIVVTVNNDGCQTEVDLAERQQKAGSDFHHTDRQEYSNLRAQSFICSSCLSYHPMAGVRVATRTLSHHSALLDPQALRSQSDVDVTKTPKPLPLENRS